MAAPRTSLQTLLEGLLGSSNVYFQPPAGVRMLYPCIVYERSRIDSTFADNIVYGNMKQYTITVIDRDPDSAVPDKVKNLPTCYFDRHFTADNLNHDVFTLYY